MDSRLSPGAVVHHDVLAKFAIIWNPNEYLGFYSLLFTVFKLVFWSFDSVLIREIMLMFSVHTNFFKRQDNFFPSIQMKWTWAHNKHYYSKFDRTPTKLVEAKESELILLWNFFIIKKFSNVEVGSFCSSFFYFSITINF